MREKSCKVSASKLFFMVATNKGALPTLLVRLMYHDEAIDIALTD